MVKGCFLSMASDYWNVPTADLEAIEANLASMHETLNGVESDAFGVDRTDDIHGHVIVTAVEGFFADWKTARKKLIDNIDKLGVVSGDIARTVREFDAETASGLNEMDSKLREGGEQ